MDAGIEPAFVEAAGQPGPPADLQRGIDEGVEHADDHPDRGERREHEQELIPEGLGVIFLERVEEVAVPEVQAQLQRHLREGDEDRQRHQPLSDLALGAAEEAERPDLVGRFVASGEIGVGDQSDRADRLEIRDAEHDGGEDHGTGGGKGRRKQGGDRRGQEPEGGELLGSGKANIADAVDRNEDLEEGGEPARGIENARHGEAAEAHVERRRRVSGKEQKSQRESGRQRGLQAEARPQNRHAGLLVGYLSKSGVGTRLATAALTTRHGEIVAPDGTRSGGDAADDRLKLRIIVRSW